MFMWGPFLLKSLWLFKLDSDTDVFLDLKHVNFVNCRKTLKQSLMEKQINLSLLEKIFWEIFYLTIPSDFWGHYQQ